MSRRIPSRMIAFCLFAATAETWAETRIPPVLRMSRSMAVSSELLPR